YDLRGRPGQRDDAGRCGDRQVLAEVAAPPYSTSCVQRNNATVLPFASSTTASHTCVVRPPCASVARHASSPSRAVPRKFALSSIVVKPTAPSGSDATQP